MIAHFELKLIKSRVDKIVSQRQLSSCMTNNDVCLDPVPKPELQNYISYFCYYLHI